jgi:hypothetical protein
MDALRPERDEMRAALAERVSKAITGLRWDVKPPGRGEELVRNLFLLAEGLRLPTLLGDALWTASRRRADLPLPGSANPDPEHPLVRAVMYNQPDGRFWDFWATLFLTEREPRSMPGYVARGLVGLGYAGVAPNIVDITNGANEARKWNLRVKETTSILAQSFSQLWKEFASHPTLSVEVVKAALNVPRPWNEVTLDGWAQSVKGNLPAQPAETHEYIQNIVKLAGRLHHAAAAA